METGSFGCTQCKSADESVCSAKLEREWQTHLCGKWRHPTAAATQLGSTGRRAETAELLHSVPATSTCTAACSRSVATSACMAASPADCSRLRASAAQWATADPSSSAAACLPAGVQQISQADLENGGLPALATLLRLPLWQGPLWSAAVTACAGRRELVLACCCRADGSACSVECSCYSVCWPREACCVTADRWGPADTPSSEAAASAAAPCSC